MNKQNKRKDLWHQLNPLQTQSERRANLSRKMGLQQQICFRVTRLSHGCDLGPVPSLLGYCEPVPPRTTHPASRGTEPDPSTLTIIGHSVRGSVSPQSMHFPRDAFQKHNSACWAGAKLPGSSGSNCGSVSSH